MERTPKGRLSRWYGYLAAGARSSPVLRDDRLETGNRKTIYLFNLQRGEIIEYALEIVGKKLRELQQDESGYISALDAGYKIARRGFRGRGTRERSSRDATVSPLQRSDAYTDTDDYGEDDPDLLPESDEA